MWTCDTTFTPCHYPRGSNNDVKSASGSTAYCAWEMLHWPIFLWVWLGSWSERSWFIMSSFLCGKVGKQALEPWRGSRDWRVATGVCRGLFHVSSVPLLPNRPNPPCDAFVQAGLYTNYVIIVSLLTTGAWQTIPSVLSAAREYRFQNYFFFPTGTHAHCTCINIHARAHPRGHARPPDGEVW